jgi:phage shock protein C
MIAGVCAGIAEHLGWPPNRLRLAYVLVSIFSAGFPGILVYLFLWFVMPGPDRR